jgi:Tuberculosis necrotizing toxin
MTEPSEVLSRAQARGVDVERVVVGTEVDVIPRAPSHRWIVVPMSDGTVTLGGMDRGSFAAYGKFGDPEVAAQALAQGSMLDAPPLPENRPVKALVTATQALLDQLRGVVEDGEPLTAAHLPVGAVLDHIGDRSGHVLYLFATPFEQRSLPPTDLNLTRTGYVLDASLPETCTVSKVEPWFGQPGGGVMVTLDRVIAYYVDVGVLAPFSVEVGARE